MSMVINGTSGLTFPDGSLQGIGVGRRNLIINGAMQVAQRGTQVTGVTTPGYYTCDRFKPGFSGLGTWTIEQSTDAPDGFSNSLKMTATTADASPASTDYSIIAYHTEAQNLQHLAFGTSNAKTITLSFWVKSNVTGDASFEIRQDDNSVKGFGAAYTINSADTWEQKTIVIPADTSGVIDNDNGRGLSLNWWLNSGSVYSSGSHQSTWAAFANGNLNPSNLGVGGATSDYFAITGVQLEVGSVATPFEHRSYGEELALCQRYCVQINSNNKTYDLIFPAMVIDADDANTCWQPPVTLRTAPTVIVSDAAHICINYNGGNNESPVNIGQITSTYPSVYFNLDTNTAVLTAGQMVFLAFTNATSGGYIRFDAEL